MSSKWKHDQWYHTADEGGGYNASHTHPSGHGLWISYSPTDSQAPEAFHVRISHDPPGDPHSYRSAHMDFPSLADPKFAYVNPPGHSMYMPAPSEALRALIRHHGDALKAGETAAWMPLLDQLAEEYPSMSPMVDHHTAARHAADD